MERGRRRGRIACDGVGERPVDARIHLPVTLSVGTFAPLIEPQKPRLDRIDYPVSDVETLQYGGTVRDLRKVQTHIELFGSNNLQ